MIQPEAAPRSRPEHVNSGLRGLNPGTWPPCTTDDSGGLNVLGLILLIQNENAQTT